MKLYPEAAQLYVRESGNIRTDTSQRTYLKEMRRIQRMYPDRHIADLTTQELARACLTKGGEASGAAGKTVSKRMGHLRGTFRWLRWRGLVDPDPAHDLPQLVKPSKNGVRHHTWLTDPQIDALLASYDRDDLFQERDRTIMLIGLNSGLRLDAMSNLTWNCFDADYSSMRLIVKGGKPIELPVLEELAEALPGWRKHCWMGGTAVIPSIREAFDPAALRRRKSMNWDRPLGEAGIYQVVRKAGDRIGVHLTPHDLRRSFAAWLERMDVDLRTIQQLLGHENIATTVGYLEKNPDRLRRAVVGLRRNT